MASAELGSSSGVFAGGLGPGEGGRGDIRCPPLGQGRHRKEARDGETERGNAAFVWLDHSAARSVRCSQFRRRSISPALLSLPVHENVPWCRLMPSLPRSSQTSWSSCPELRKGQETFFSGFNSEPGVPGPSIITQQTLRYPTPGAWDSPGWSAPAPCCPGTSSPKPERSGSQQ